MNRVVQIESIDVNGGPIINILFLIFWQIITTLMLQRCIALNVTASALRWPGFLFARNC